MSEQQTTALKPVDAIRQDMSRMSEQFRLALPSHINTEKFMRVAITACQQNADLVNADRQSLYGAFMKAAQDGLLADGREGAVVIFGGKATWMPMVAGIMKKVRNSGEISTWSVQVVKANDAFDYELGDDEKIIHKPALSSRGETVGAYSIVTMKDGEKSREFMDVDQIKAIQERSRGGKSGPWVSDFDEMAKKTVVRRHSKRLPMSTDLDEFLRQDDELFLPEKRLDLGGDQGRENPATKTADQDNGAKKRPSRLGKVLEKEVPDADDIPI